MKRTKIISNIIFAIISAVFLSVHISALSPIVIDFSESDFIMEGVGGMIESGFMDVVNDDGKRVLYAECIEGYNPADDPDGTRNIGDLYASINNFADYGVNGSVYKWIKMSVKNESSAPFFELHFASPTSDYHISTSVNLEINPGSTYTTYIYNITEQCKKYFPKRPEGGDPDNYPDHWNGIISGFRLDFMYYEESGGHARTGDKIYIEYVAFFDSKEAAEGWVFTPSRGAIYEQPDENDNEVGNNFDSERIGDSVKESSKSIYYIICVLVILGVSIITLLVRNLILYEDFGFTDFYIWVMGIGSFITTILLLFFNNSNITEIFFLGSIILFVLLITRYGAKCVMEPGNFAEEVVGVIIRILGYITLIAFVILFVMFIIAAISDEDD